MKKPFATISGEKLSQTNFGSTNAAHVCSQQGLAKGPTMAKIGRRGPSKWDKNSSRVSFLFYFVQNGDIIHPHGHQPKYAQGNIDEAEGFHRCPPDAMGQNRRGLFVYSAVSQTGFGGVTGMRGPRSCSLESAVRESTSRMGKSFEQQLPALHSSRKLAPCAAVESRLRNFHGHASSGISEVRTN